MVNILNEWGVALAECGLGNDAAARRSLCRTLELTVDKLPSPTYQILCLPLAAILAARAGEDEHAAELLGLTSTAPPEMIGWMAKWPLLRDIRRDLENTLGVGTYVDVFERGKRQELSAVIAALRTEYEAAVS